MDSTNSWLPIISLSLTALVSGIIGSSSGAVGIASSHFLPDLYGNGIDPELLHRVVVVASATVNSSASVWCDDYLSIIYQD